MDVDIHKLKRHDPEVFKHVYETYHAKLYFFVLKHTQSPFLAEEAVQLTFMKVWEKAGGLSETIELSIQIFRIAKSVMIDLLRKETVRNNHRSFIASQDSASHEINDVDNRHELLRVHRAIDDMSPVRKKVFMLSRMEGHSHLTIAEHLSISPKTVENHIARAVRQLRKTLSIFLA